MDIDFEEHRSHLRNVAYRMLGSLAEADDAVQEAWLRLDRAAPGDLANPRGWLTTVVSRICLDMLRSRTSRREEPMGPRAERPAGRDAEQEMMLADSVGLAVLVVLDKLEPAERLAFVLHDLFGVPFDEIAPIVGRSLDATRQLASRARRRVQGSPPPDAVLDGTDVGGVETRGAATVARVWTEGATAFAHFADFFTIALVDGAVGLVMAPKGRVTRALRFTFDSGRIARAEIIADRAKLDALEVAPIEPPT